NAINSNLKAIAGVKAMKTFCSYCRTDTETLTLTGYETQFCDVCSCKKEGQKDEQRNNNSCKR
ncbi:MAG: hypothetical protein RSD17_00845, partial [Oscillospiraceae bacterium]